MENNKPLVTVFICTYRKLDLLAEALDSLFNQDYPNIELIISDDGSPNFDRNQIKGLTENAPDNIKEINIIHHETNLGTVKNLNNLLRKSNGDYYIGLSQDDLFYRGDTITKIVDFFTSNDALIITSKRVPFTKNLDDFKEAIPTYKDYRYLLEDEDKLFYRLCINNFISGASTYHSKKLFKKFGYFDEEYIILEDQPKYLQLARKKVKIHFFNEITKYYRMDGISTNKNINHVLLDDAKKTIEKEVFPYIDKCDNRLHRVSKFNYEYYKSYKKLNFLIVTKYLDAIIYKFLIQLGILKSK